MKIKLPKNLPYSKFRIRPIFRQTAKALTDYTSQLKPFACKAVVRKSLFTFEWQDCTAVVCAVPISVQAQC